MIFVGDDWAEDHHDVYVMDADGARLASRRPPRADRLDGSRRRSRAVPASPGARNPALGPSSGARGARERDLSTGLGAGTRDVSMPSLPLNVPDTRLVS